MRQPSAARQRTLALQARAITFSAAVNSAYPEHLTQGPSAIVWEQLVRAADSASNRTTVYHPDQAYQPSAIYLPTIADATKEHQTLYTYDAQHRLTGITQQLCTISSGHACSSTTATGSDTYAYDDSDTYGDSDRHCDSYSDKYPDSDCNSHIYADAYAD